MVLWQFHYHPPPTGFNWNSSLGVNQTWEYLPAVPRRCPSFWLPPPPPSSFSLRSAPLWTCSGPCARETGHATYLREQTACMHLSTEHIKASPTCSPPDPNLMCHPPPVCARRKDEQLLLFVDYFESLVHLRQGVNISWLVDLLSFQHETFRWFKLHERLN